MWNPNINAINITKLVQIIFSIDCSHLISQFDFCELQLVYPTMEHHPVRNLQHKTLQTNFDMFDQS